MSDNLKNLFVEIGWLADTASQSKVEAAAKATEDRITQQNARALAQRVAQENRARQEKIAGDLEAGRILSAQDRKFIEDQEKHRAAIAEVSHKREVEGSKKTSILRAESFKEAEANFLRLSGVAQAFSTGLSGALGALPFGAMVLGVQRTAAGLSDLAVQARRVGASASHIQRFIYAMSFSGVSEGNANAALEGFASKIKGNEPGFREGLSKLGVQTTDENGKPLDIEQLLESFGRDFLAKQSYTQAQKYAGDYGIGVDALNAFRDQGTFQRGARDYDDRAKTFGFDGDKASKDAREVDQAWLKVETDLKLINIKLQSEFFVPMANGFDVIAKKLEENPQAAENFGRAMEAMALAVSARALPPIANLLVKLTGLQAIIGGGLGSLLGIVVNPVVALGASAESTPGAGVPADAAERAKVAEENKRLTDEANKKQGSTGSFWQDSWNYIKGKVGLGDDAKTKADIATTAEATKKLADKADGFGGGDSGAGGSGGDDRCREA